MTKGGFHVVCKNEGGQYKVLGKGPHRGIARHMSSLTEKNISWHRDLFKSQTSTVANSTPANHYEQAEWHSAQHATLLQDLKKNDDIDQRMDCMYHRDMALRHYQMSGLSFRDAVVHCNDAKFVSNDHTAPSPYETEQLSNKYAKKNPNAALYGIDDE
jgi:hypothetical protein